MKLINKYKELKNINQDMVYIFESGVFCVLFNDDAELASNLLNLKLVGLSEFDCKCGFPIKSKEKYFEILDKKEIKYEIIVNEKKIEDSKLDKNVEKEIIRKLKSINVEYYTEKEALKFLIELKELLK